MGARGGIDLGGTKIQAVVVDAAHAVLGKARRPTPTRGEPADVAAAIAAAMREAAADAGFETHELSHVGIGSPGTVDAAQGTVSSAKNLPGWAGVYQLGPKLAEKLGTPVALGNDVQVATDAEAALGAGSGHRSMLGVFWGTGVGGGIVLDGRPWVGRGGAGEIGHVVVEVGGARCPCGRRGCMEAYAGRNALEARARERHDKGEPTELFKIARKRGRERLTSGIWAAALERGDPLATKLIDRAVAMLGAGVASVDNVLDVEVVILGGGLGVRLGQPYADRIAQAMQPHLFFSDRPPPVVVAALGDLGGAIGASLLTPA
ncbi:MAG TPA: ROK family protein [Solirubrobacteraceae bacterium]|nr:ROK family protein [Solirubrobacteraceae bacterium]